MVLPKVGDIVHFWQAPDCMNIPGRVGASLAAVVADVSGDRLTLSVWDSSANAWPVPNVPFIAAGMALPPDSDFTRWATLP